MEKMKKEQEFRFRYMSKIWDAPIKVTNKKLLSHLTPTQALTDNFNL